MDDRYTRWRVLAAWAASIATALIFLTGRYDWSPRSRDSAVNSYLSSAFFLVLILPVSYYLMSALWPRRRKLALALTFLLGVIHSLPYRWLGLTRFLYRQLYLDKNPGAAQPVHIDWLPGAIINHSASMPHEVPIFLILGGLGAASALLYWRTRPVASRRASGRTAAFWLGLYSIILTSTWMHLSLRSPASYVGHFEQPPAANRWYIWFLFPNNQGAIMADYYGQLPLEHYFGGKPLYQSETVFIRRIFVPYIVSQWTCFFSPFHVYLIMNILLWFAACLCMYGFALTAWGDAQTAVYAAFMVSCGPGFILWVAQPANYLAGFTCIIVILYLFETFFVPRPSPPWPRYVLFGCIFGLAMLVYDLFTWIPLLIAYAIFKRIPLKRIIASISIAIAIYGGFLAMARAVLGYEFSDHNSKYISFAIQGLVKQLQDWNFGNAYVLLVTFIRKFSGATASCTFFIPTVLACFGALGLRRRSHTLTVLILSIPPILLMAIMHFGDVHWGKYTLADIPRYNYGIYPSVYLLAGHALTELRRIIAEARHPVLSRAIIVGVLASIFIIANIDVLGYAQLYYYMFWPDGGYFD